MTMDVSLSANEDTTTRVMGLLSDSAAVTGGLALPSLHLTLHARAQPAVQSAQESDGCFAVVDGEIYNLYDLGADMAGQGNDAERLLALFRRHGRAIFARLDAAAGMTLFDAGEQLLYILRDPIGSAAVFYSETDGCLRWASDIRGLVSMQVDCEIDPAALDYYLTSGYVPAPWSMLRAIRKLAPGHMLVVRGTQPPRVEAYCRPTGTPQLSLDTEAIVEHLATLMPRAVQRRSRIPSRTGLLLSGGVDSMILAALMQKHAHTPVDTFTFRYLDYEGAYNEHGAASSCAAHLGMRHHVIGFGPADVVRELQDMLAVYGEPFSYGLHSLKLRGIRELGIDSVLCGTGADGWFPGRRDELSRRILSLPRPLQSALRAVATINGAAEEPGGSPGGRFDRQLSLLRSVLWTASTGLAYNPGDYITGATARRDLLAVPGLVTQGIFERRGLLMRAMQDYADEDPFHRFRFMSLRFFGAEMMQNWNHWSGRAHGLAIRTPYYDRELLSFIHRLPQLSVGKKELRQYASALLPRHMAYGPKIPQSVPLEQWLRSAPLRDLVADTLCESQLRRQGLFSPAAVAQLMARHMSGRENHAWTLWGLLTVTLWQQMITGWRAGQAFQRETPATPVIQTSTVS